MEQFVVSRRALLDGAASRASDPSAPDRYAVVAHPVLTAQLDAEVVGGERTSFDLWVDDQLALVHQRLEPSIDALAWSALPPFLPTMVCSLVGLAERVAPQARRAIVDRAEVATALQAGADIDEFGPVACLWSLRWLHAGSSDGATFLDQGVGRAAWQMTGQSSAGELHFSECGTAGAWRLVARIASIRPGPQSDTAVNDGDQPAE